MSRSIFIRLLFTALLVTAACSWGAEFHVELGAGTTDYRTRSDGIWYQLGMPHRLELNGRAYKIGVTGDAYAADDWRAAWHVDYVNLGHLRAQCACTTIDALYDNRSHRLLASAAYVPVANFVGHGGTQGILLSLAPYVQRGTWRVGTELGLFPYRPNWQETVYGWHVQPGPLVDAHLATPRAWQLGGVAGAFITHGRASLSYEFFYLPTRFDDRHPPALWTGAHVLMVSYQL